MQIIKGRKQRPHQPSDVPRVRVRTALRRLTGTEWNIWEEAEAGVMSGKVREASYRDNHLHCSWEDGKQCNGDRVALFEKFGEICLK